MLLKQQVSDVSRRSSSRSVLEAETARRSSVLSTSESRRLRRTSRMMQAMKMKAEAKYCEEKEAYEEEKREVEGPPAMTIRLQAQRLRKAAEIMMTKHGGEEKVGGYDKLTTPAQQAALAASPRALDFIDAYLNACKGRPVIISQKRAPFLIVGCTGEWCDLCGFTSSQAVGQAPGALLQGEFTDTNASRAFARAATLRGHATAKLVNYTKNKMPFIHCLETFGLVDPGTGIQYFATESHEHEHWKVEKWGPVLIDQNKQWRT